MPDAVTLDDVARVARVSPSTVSRVLNGTARVNPLKHKAVLEAIEHLGYHPNLIAKGLAQGRSLTIGVVTQDIASRFYSEMLKGIEQVLEGTPYHSVYASGNWRVDRELAVLRVLLARQVDAIIVLGGFDPEEHLLELSRRLPIVIASRRLASLENACLMVDNVQGAYLGTRHLIELGHRKIAHISGPPFHSDAMDRLEGYKRALSEFGLPFDPRLVVEGDYLEPSGVLAVEMLMNRGVSFTAIFAANDQMAYGVMLALYRRRIRIPEEVSLLGFDDLPTSNYSTPPLTTVKQPTFELGREAAKTALAMLESKPYTLPHLSTQLIIRESTALLRGEPYVPIGTREVR